MKQQLKNYIQNLKPTLGGKFLYRFLPFRKKIVLANMHLVFGDVLTEQEIILLAQSFYSHLLTSVKENIALRFMSEQQLKDKAEIRGYEKVLAAAEQKKGIIILAGHFGNWEFAPIAGILNFKQFQGRFHFIRKRQSIKLVEKIFFSNFTKAGLVVIPSKNALSKVTSALENNDAVVFIMDQYAHADSKEGIMVEFFGTKAGTYKSLAMIAKHSGAAVIPTSSYRLPNNKHVLEFHDPVTWQAAKDYKQELYLNTKRYNETLEQMLLAHPEQWLWVYKRWR